MKQVLNNAELAKELGISKSYLSMIMSGQRRCPEPLVGRLSSQKVVNSVAKSSLARRRSTAELLPHNACIYL